MPKLNPPDARRVLAWNQARDARVLRRWVEDSLRAMRGETPGESWKTLVGVGLRQAYDWRWDEGLVAWMKLAQKVDTSVMEVLGEQAVESGFVKGTRLIWDGGSWRTQARMVVRARGLDKQELAERLWAQTRDTVRTQVLMLMAKSPSIASPPLAWCHDNPRAVTDAIRLLAGEQDWSAMNRLYPWLTAEMKDKARLECAGADHTLAAGLKEQLCEVLPRGDEGHQPGQGAGAPRARL